MAPALGIIADDFTGAVMVAAMLETAGVACPVVFDPAAIGPTETAPVIMVAARSRTVAAAEAIAEVAHIADCLTAAGCTRLAYKACASFDSTDAGNIGPAADLLAARAGRRPVLMSAGFPRFGATVHQGYLFYRGRLVSDSIKRLDPLTPMTDPDLVRFLGLQTPHPLGLIAHGILVEGLDAALVALQGLTDAGMGHVLCDSSDDGDVEVTAKLAVASGLPVVASDPLIVALARHLARGPAALPLPEQMPGGPVAVLAGSTGPVVLEQLAVLARAHPVLVLDVLDPRGAAALVAETLDWAAQQAGAFAISTATDASGVARTQAALGSLGAARRAEALLGAVAAGLRDRGQRRFVVAGGETSGAVVAALGIGRARALAEGPLGLGFCLTGGDDPLALFLKPGKLGAADVLARAVSGCGFEGRRVGDDR
ncbi:MAG: four-carbon acid sugar kinase family protein [Paracoccaceae bacterium]